LGEISGKKRDGKGGAGEHDRGKGDSHLTSGINRSVATQRKKRSLKIFQGVEGSNFEIAPTGRKCPLQPNVRRGGKKKEGNAGKVLYETAGVW